MIGAGVVPNDPVYVQLKDISRLSGMSATFLNWFYRHFEGLGDYIEDVELPISNLMDIAHKSVECTDMAMRKRFLVNHIARMEVFRYRATNTDDEVWNPVECSFSEFALSSERFIIWKCVNPSLDERVHQMVGEKLHALS